MDFSSAYDQGFARVAACTITTAIADPMSNAAAVLHEVRACVDEGVAVAVFPELCLTGYAIDDLLLQEPVLDAVEAARSANGPSDHRHHLAHLQIVHPEDIPRFRVLGAVANAQPLWACYDPQMSELTIPFLGEERASWQYPFGSLVRAGATLAFGSDWSVSTPDPLAEMHVAVNRRASTSHPGLAGAGPQGYDEVFLPDERLDLALSSRPSK